MSHQHRPSTSGSTAPVGKKKRICISLGRPGGGGGRRTTRKRKQPATKGGGGAAAAGVPALLRSRPRGRAGRSVGEDDDPVGGGGSGATSGRDDEEEDEYSSSLPLEALGGTEGGEESDPPSDALLALRSLVRRGAAALCPPPPSSADASYAAVVPFVLRPMLRYALLSTVTASAVAAASNSTFGAPSRSPAEAAAAAEESNREAAAAASTGLNVDLMGLQRGNKIRMMQLQGTGDAENDLAAMETAEYVRGCRDALEADIATSSTANLSSEERRTIVDFFVESLRLWTRTSVREVEVDEALRQVQRKKGNVGSTLHPAIGASVAAAPPRPPSVGARTLMDYLTSIGILLPRRDSPSSYWFSLPGLGLAARFIVQGRNRVLSKLRMAKYEEMKRSVLELGVVEVNRRGSEGGENHAKGMPAAFVVRDLLSRGVVRVRETPNGQFIKLI